MLIEFHLVQNHAPSNLNRDESGSPKDCIFGGVRRARISSQCLKHAIRKSRLFMEELDGCLGARTRMTPELVMDNLAADPGTLPQGLISQIGRAMTSVAKKATTGEKEEEDNTPEETPGTEQGPSEGLLLTPQGIFLTVNEAESLARLLKEAFAEDPDGFTSYMRPIDHQIVQVQAIGISEPNTKYPPAKFMLGKFQVFKAEDIIPSEQEILELRKKAGTK